MKCHNIECKTPASKVKRIRLSLGNSPIDDKFVLYFDLCYRCFLLYKDEKKLKKMYATWGY